MPDTNTTTERGLQLPCPCCGEANANVSLHLDDCETFTCRECDAEFTTEDVKQFIARWQPVLAWIDQAPATK